MSDIERAIAGLDRALELTVQLGEAAMRNVWQPIETAPSNLKGVLLYYPPHRGHEAFMAISLGLDNGSSWRPTHWMPLPEPPSDDHRKAKRR